MNRSALVYRIVIAVAVIFVVVGRPHGLHAQSLWDYRVGDTRSRLSKLGPVSGQDKYKSNDLLRWVLPDRNVLRATVDPVGEIVYLESAWGGKSDATGCDLAGLRFGATTLADLYKRFGSKGFGFKKRPRVLTTDDGVMLINSWETDNAVVTFYTRISAADYAKAQAEGSDVATGYAKLDAISLANAAYTKREWGDRVYDPAYKKITWK